MDKSDRDISEWDARLKQQLERSFHNYHKRRIDLSVARDNFQLDWTGETIIVEKASSPIATAMIRLMFEDADELVLEENVEIKSIFNRIYLTNDAQADEWLDVIAGINFDYKKKIAELPCTSILELEYFSHTAAPYSGGNLYGNSFDPDVVEKLYIECTIPKWIESGADAVLKIRGFPPVNNDTGFDKVVRLYGQYVIIPKTGIPPGSTNAPAVEITIPDTEPAKTLHVNDLLTLTNLMPDDIFNVTIIRDATHANDTWAQDWVLLRGIYFELVQDKIGER